MSPSPSSALVRVPPLAARILLGLLFTLTGLNGFLNFLPPPKDPMPEAAMAFAVAMMKTGYLMKLVAGTQLLGGLLLLSGRWVPLALLLLAPVLVNILCFHAFLAPTGALPGILATALELYLAWHWRAAFRGLFAA